MAYAQERIGLTSAPGTRIPVRQAPKDLLRILVLAFLLSLGVVLRILLALSFPGNFDRASYEIVGTIVQSGGNVYAETARYNYAPPWFLILGAFEAMHLQLRVAIPVLLTAADLGLATLIYVWTSSARAALLFFRTRSSSC